MGNSDFDGGFLKVALFLTNKLLSPAFTYILPKQDLISIKQHKQYGVEDHVNYAHNNC
jgi:hypothetical protein